MDRGAWQGMQEPWGCKELPHTHKSMRWYYSILHSTEAKIETKKS